MTDPGLSAAPTGRPWRTWVLYGLLFFVPAAAVFALVQRYFRGLPPRYRAELVFRIDPYLGTPPGAGEDVPLLDVGSVRIEIRSRERLQEALRGLRLYRARRGEDQRELLVDQIRENLRVRVERQPGGRGYLARLTLIHPHQDPTELGELLRRIRAVYMKYNLEKFIQRAAREVRRLGTEAERLTKECRQHRAQLQRFEAKDINRKLLGSPPPILAEIQRKRAELARFEQVVGEDARKRREDLEKEIESLEDLRRSAPQVNRQHEELQRALQQAEAQLRDTRRALARAEEYLRYLRTESAQRFAVVRAPPPRPEEREETSRLVLGLALGAMGGLFVVLCGLLVSLLGRR